MQNHFLSCHYVTKAQFFRDPSCLCGSYKKEPVEQAPGSPINANKPQRFLDGSLGRQPLGTLYQNKLGRSGAVRFGQEQGGHSLHIREFASACHGNGLLEIQRNHFEKLALDLNVFDL